MYDIIWRIGAILLFIFIIIPTLIGFISGAPFVPTPMRAIRKVLKNLPIKKGMRVYEIGCGDGRFIHEANTRYGANCVGFELSLPVIFLAYIRKYVTGSKAKLIWGDFRRYNLHDADIIFCYLMPDNLKNFIEKFETELKPGTLIASYAFRIGKWKPHKELPWDKKERIATIWIYKIGEQ